MMYLIRTVAILIFFCVAALYATFLAPDLVSGTFNHMQVGVFVVSLYCLLATAGHDDRDKTLRKILKALSRDE